MEKLFLSTGKGQVQIAELALITGKEQAVIGNDQRDLILRTAGNIQIQVANKFYTLDFKSSTTGSTITSNVKIVATNVDMSKLVYPGEGVFVFVMEDSSFYIAVANGYVRINKASSTTSQIYLSYDNSQTLTGAQKQTLLINTGSINSFGDIANYTTKDVYTNQVLYNISTGKHYRLKDVNSPAVIANWVEAYLSLPDGGVIQNSVAIDKSGTLVAAPASALHINNTDVLSLGDAQYSTGTKISTDLVNTVFQNLATNNRAGYIFKTYDGNLNTLIPLVVYGNNAAFFGLPNFNYNLTTYGTSLFTDIVSTSKGINDPSYSPGITGTGYAIYKDLNDNKWVLECDRTIVRSNIAKQSSFESKSINGSYWSNPSINVTSFNITGTIFTYGLANKLGNYKDVSGTKVLRTLSDKPQYVQAMVPTDITDPSSSTTLQLIKLNYGYGDRDSGGTVITDSCFFKEDPGGAYSVPQGQYNLVSGSFVPAVGGAYIIDQVISVVQILTPSYTSCAVGDLLFYQTWLPDTTDDQRAVVEVVAIDNAAGAIYVYAYNGSRIFTNQELVRVGNTISSVNNGIHFNGIDTQGDYIEHLTNITSFHGLFSNFFLNEAGYEELVDMWQPTTANTTNKFGALNNLSDPDLLLGQTSQVGLYSSNAYLKGNFVAQRLLLNDITTTTALDFVVIYNPTTARLTKHDISSLVSNWNTAYGWGDHAAAGYATTVAVATDIATAISDKVTFKEVATYADMISDSTPTIMCTYKVLADEDKSAANTIYQWWPDGKRVLLTTTADN